MTGYFQLCQRFGENAWGEFSARVRMVCRIVINMMQSNHSRASALSPLGTVSLEVSGSSAVAIEICPAGVPALPAGMVIDGVLLFSIRLALKVSSQSPVQISVTVDRDGYPETGQWLDSMAFGNDAGVLQVAMRDDEWLAAKGIVAEPAKYGRRGFDQTINEAPAGTVLYASAAWRNAPSSVNDASTWFAADLVLPG